MSLITPDSAVPCNVCQSRATRRLFDFQIYPVLECGECALRFLHPQPDDATLGRIYGGHYFLASGDAAAEERMHEMKRRTAALYCDRLIAAQGGKLGRLLEIGCGWGDFLFEARARGFEIQGLEYSPDATAAANRRLGGDFVQSGSLENASYRDGEFDVIAFFDLIEHVRDPKWFLGRIAALLRPGGMIMIVTPTLDSLSSHLLGRRWMEYKIEHLYYFNKRSLGRALKDAGFGEISIRPNVKILSFDYVERHFARFKVPVVSPMMAGARAICPDPLATRYVKTKASGMMVMARKAGGGADDAMLGDRRSRVYWKQSRGSPAGARR